MSHELSGLIFSFVKPIYAFENKNRKHIGTCVLFESGKRRFLITAAHVLTQLSSVQLYLQDTPLRGGYWSSKDKNIDIAIYEMSHEEISSLPDCMFLNEAIFNDQPIKKEQVCALLGYPVSKNKKFLNTAQEVSPEIRLVETRVIAIEDKNDKHHFWIEYTRKLFSPIGMSGGLVTSFSSYQPPVIYILGMPVEFHEQKNAIKCIKYQLIINSIKKILSGNPMP